MSQTIEIELSEDVFLAMQKDPKDLAKEMRLAAAVKWYELGLLSRGSCGSEQGRIHKWIECGIGGTGGANGREF